jgi:hypothetical protein
MPKQKLTENEANRVTIRIWHGEDLISFVQKGTRSLATKGFFKSGLMSEENAERKLNNIGPRAGHVSLQTYIGGKNNKGIYASLWPNGDPQALITRFGVKGYHSESYEEDLKLELGKDPDEVIEIYTLDVDAINEAFLKFENLKFNWSIWGSSIFRHEKSRNCSGLVTYLLMEGKYKEQLKKYKKGKLNDVEILLYLAISIILTSLLVYTASLSVGTINDAIADHVLSFFDKMIEHVQSLIDTYNDKCSIPENSLVNDMGYYSYIIPFSLFFVASLLYMPAYFIKVHLLFSAFFKAGETIPEITDFLGKIKEGVTPMDVASLSRKFKEYEVNEFDFETEPKEDESNNGNELIRIQYSPVA